MKAIIVMKIGVLLSTVTFCLGIARTATKPNPPPHEDVALMARYVMHKCNWVSLATLSTQKTVRGYPFVTLKSLSDGPLGNSTGVPFLYMTEMDVSGKDVEFNNNVTIMATLAQSEYCNRKDLDPQDPRCAKVIISGNLVKVEESSPEYNFGKNSLFERHPAMKDWPSGHAFYVAKLELQQICVLDFFGGIEFVTPADYFSANVTNFINLDSYFQRVSVVAIKGNM